MERTGDASVDDAQAEITQRRAAIVRAMRAGGYWEAITNGGDSLKRVHRFLRVLAGELPATLRSNQRPWLLPLFDGLTAKPFWDPSVLEATGRVEAAFRLIQKEATGPDAQRSFAAYAAPDRGSWAVHPLFYMGTTLEPFARNCPKTLELLANLPRCARRYPWGEAMLSRLDPGTHLTEHYSVDNLRVRLHLGLFVPEQSGMQVAGETRRWPTGGTLLLEDSFIHKAFNDADSARMILSADFWHPDLTDAETEALTAGFRKAEVRGLMAEARIRMLPERLGREWLRQLLPAFAEQDREPLIAQYWR